MICPQPVSKLLGQSVYREWIPTPSPKPSETESLEVRLKDPQFKEAPQESVKHRHTKESVLEMGKPDLHLLQDFRQI